jgi:hypothetical protein
MVYKQIVLSEVGDHTATYSDRLASEKFVSAALKYNHQAIGHIIHVIDLAASACGACMHAVPDHMGRQQK